jgi:hypothetical protein
VARRHKMRRKMDNGRSTPAMRHWGCTDRPAHRGTQHQVPHRPPPTPVTTPGQRKLTISICLHKAQCTDDGKTTTDARSDTQDVEQVAGKVDLTAFCV